MTTPCLVCGLVTQNPMEQGALDVEPGPELDSCLLSPRQRSLRLSMIIAGFHPWEEAEGPRGVILELPYLRIGLQNPFFSINIYKDMPSLQIIKKAYD